MVARYFQIQVLEHDTWEKRAEAQHRLVISEPFKRGSFLIKGEEKFYPLAIDVTRFHLCIDPQKIPESYKSLVVNQIRKIAALPEEVEREFYRKCHFRKIGCNLSSSQKEEILAFWTPFAKKHKIASNALFFLTDYQRSYPYGPLLGQVLHTIRDLKDETTKQGVPTGGLESYFNEILQGKEGKRRLLRSALHHLEAEELVQKPENGADIYLTIDQTIQAIAEEELAKGVAQMRAKGGWAVMMETKTGAILAAAQVPFFDPSRYADYFNDPHLMEHSKAKIITDPFEIGSIIKPITVAMALLANNELAALGKPKIFDPDEKMDSTRTLFPGRRYKPLYDIPRMHKALNMEMALQKSSNVYMAELADRMVNQLGVSWYRKQLVETFGFEQKTGIELPGESVGMVPSPDRKYPNGAPEWSVPTPFSLSIGYNLLATSLQMLRAIAVFSNGGYLVKPTLVDKIVKDQEVIYLRKVERKRVLPEEIASMIGKTMKYGTKPGATGRLGAISGYTEAGKTGSAEKIIDGVYSKKKHISSFIGFSPARFDETENPLILIVSIDEAEPIIVDGVKTYLGGGCSAPVFREIMRRSLEYLGVPKDDPYGYPVGDPRYSAEKADWMKEVKALKELYEKWN